jgi:hypothetical protein
MATASLSLPTAQPRNLVLRQLRAFTASFRWALEVQRRCNAIAAGGGRLDGDAIRRIMGETDEWIARN